MQDDFFRIKQIILQIFIFFHTFLHSLTFFYQNISITVGGFSDFQFIRINMIPQILHVIHFYTHHKSDWLDRSHGRCQENAQWRLLHISSIA